MDALYLCAALTVPLLGHPSFNVREHATQTLMQMGPLGYPQVVAAMRCSDMEIVTRGGGIANCVLGRWADAAADTVRSTRFSNRLPWMDGLDRDWPNRSDVISAYMESASAKQEHRRWWNYRHATREFVRDLFATGRSWQEVIAILDVMADAELAWIAQNPTAKADLIELAESAPQPREAK